MTKSRTALATLTLLLLSEPGAAFAALQDDDEPAVAPTAEAVIAAWRAHSDRVMRRRCAPIGPGDDILVCGRAIETERQALPLDVEPEEGARHRLIAGEPPSAMNALHAPDACCGHGGGGLNVIGIVNALGTGIDRILHPD